MIYYFPLESLKSRYTHQLSTKWMPKAFEKSRQVCIIQ